MGSPVKPFIDPTLLTPDEWQQYLGNARAALHQNPRDREALEAIRHANDALSVYDEAAAASPGERITSGVSEGLAGLGQAAGDIPKTLLNAVLHPIDVGSHLIRPTKQDVGAIVDRITSGNQQEVARGTANAMSALLPFAKTSVKPGAPTVAEVGGRAAMYPLRLAKIWAERPFLRNAILEARLQRLTAPRTTKAESVAPGLPNAKTPPTHTAGGPLEDISQALADFKAGRISPQDFNTAMQMAGQNLGMPSEPAAPTPPPLEPIPGSPNGFLGPEGVSPPPKPSYPPTLAEMQGFRVEPLQQTAAEQAATAAAKGLRGAARDAARAAFKKAIAAGQTHEEAVIAARWAATHVGLLTQ